MAGGTVTAQAKGIFLHNGGLSTVPQRPASAARPYQARHPTLWSVRTHVSVCCPLKYSDWNLLCPKVQITSTFVIQAKCDPSKRKTDFFDMDLPGFMLEVRQSAGKTFYQRYRDAHGRERQYMIGSTKIISVRRHGRKPV
jgi:hypothetical protein